MVPDYLSNIIPALAATEVVNWPAWAVSLLDKAGGAAFAGRLLGVAVIAIIVVVVWNLAIRLLTWPFRNSSVVARRWLLAITVGIVLGVEYFVFPDEPSVFNLTLVYGATVFTGLLIGIWTTPRILYLGFYTPQRRYLWFVLGVVLIYGLVAAGVPGLFIQIGSGLFAVVLALMTLAATDPRIWAVCAHASSLRWRNAPAKVNQAPAEQTE